MKKVVHLIAGVRPNFMKIAPLWHALNATGWCLPKVVHTGQHSDINMSEWFFQDLEMGQPDYTLQAVTGSHAKVTGSIMIAYEDLLMKEKPDLVVVVGDVDSTVACAISAKKMHIPVAHLEAGLRSFDRTMPEELNRLLVDSIADILWTPSKDGGVNLKNEGVEDSRIQQVGNIMIDSLTMALPKIEKVDLKSEHDISLDAPYCVVTLHRPSNVDDKEQLERIVAQLVRISERINIIFPIHPRTKKRLIEFDLYSQLLQPSLTLCDPLSYIDFIAAVRKSSLLVTDSGGVQEETTYLGIPCLTLRPNTERPITITEGTNQLITLDNLVEKVEEIIENGKPVVPSIEMWDGKTAARVVDRIGQFLNVR
ncbi:non-hydrolyzing UDP-N-acetylglucosamine 2-epimerase [Terasakiella pusilla]|uniref:non-hydrolyzing UDP-N-acetylglucosamine 2-epimerase n=1 Tax=Terasakiella pusilla TaxID=64973 RepID=UPI003AA7BB81